MPQVQKLTPEEIKPIQELQEQYAKITLSLGEQSIKKIELEAALAEVNTEIEFLTQDYKKQKEKEQNIVKALNDKYGNGVLNLATGEITSN